jgi:SHS2 domain-containing protein
MPFRRLEHTADVGIEVEAASLPELFADAAAGLCDTLTERALVEPRRSSRVHLTAPALDLLLVEWLDELLFRFDARGELYAEHVVTIGGRAGAWRLEAESLGEPFDPQRHPQKVQVKAVTYHALEVAPVAGGWRACVLFDL